MARARRGEPLPSGIRTVALDKDGSTWLHRDDLVHWLRRDLDRATLHPRARRVLNDVVGMLIELGAEGEPAAYGVIDPTLDLGEAPT